MRKTFTWAAIILMLIVCLHDPVVSRSTPFPLDDGPNPDHPWGGEHARDGEIASPMITASGIPSIDFMNRFVIKWFHQRRAEKRQKPIVIPNTGTTTQTFNNSNPNAAD